MNMLEPKRVGPAAVVLGLLMVFLALPAYSQDSDALQAYRNGQFQLAVDITTKEIQADPGNMDSYAVLCWSLNSLKRYGDSIQYAQKGRQVSPTDHRLVEALAEASYALRNDTNAISYYQQYITLALQHDVENRYIRDAYRDMAEIFIRFGEFHHADIALVSAIQYDRGKTASEPARAARLWARLGWVREQLTDVPSAQAAYDKAITLDPANGDAVGGRERLRAKSGT